MHIPKKPKQDYAPREQGASQFLKFKDGEQVIGIVKGTFYEFYTKWTDGKSENYTKPTSGAKPRYRLNLIVKEGSDYVAKIWEFGQVVYDQLAEINDDYPIDTGFIKIKRQGTGLDTTYVVLPAMKNILSLHDQKLVDGCKLNILDIKEKTVLMPPAPRNHAPLFAEPDDEITF